MSRQLLRAVQEETPAGDDLMSLAKELRVVQDRKKEVKQESDKLEARIKELYSMIIPMMKAVGLQNFKNDEGVTFYQKTTVWTSVANPDTAFPYLRDIGLGDLIKPMVNTKSLTSAMKEMVEDGHISLLDLEARGINVRVDEMVGTLK